ncbi:MAG: hypothetical protein II957_07580, partial [Treponema sp.]|nr:hypothetical protein [Treponema sp.]
KESSTTTSSLTWGLTTINSNTASSGVGSGNNYYINTGVYLSATISGTLYGGNIALPIIF